MKRPAPSLATLVAGVLVLVTTSILGGFAGFSYRSERDRQFSRLHQEHRRLVDQLALSLALPVWNFDRAQIDRIIESAMQNQDVVGVAVKLNDVNGTLQARGRDETGAPRVTANEPDPADAYVELRKITAGGDALGSVRVWVTPRHTQAMLRTSLGWTLANIFTVELVLVGSLYLVLWQLVLRPIRTLERHAVVISTFGSIGLELNAWLPRELAGLREALNQMLGQLQSRYDALRRSEERFQMAVRGSSDGLWDWNVATNEVFYSDRMLELLGHAPGEFPGVFASFESRLHPEDHDRIQEQITAHLERRAPYDVEYRLRTKTGGYRWFRARGQANWDAAGKPVRMAGSLTDITEKRRAEAALQESELRLREIFNHTTDAVFLVNVTEDGRFVYESFNPASERVSGFTNEQVRGRRPEEFMPPGLAARLNANYQRCLEANGLVRYIEELTFPIGVRCFDTVQVPIRDGRGRIYRIAGFARDITEQVRAEESLRAHERRFRSYFELPIVGLAITSPEKGILAINQKFCDLLGYPHDELVQKRWSDITHPDDLNLDLAHYRAMLAGEADGYSVEKRYLRKDGSVLFVSTSVRCVRRADGSPDYFIGVIQDITDRIRAEAERAGAARREQLALEDYTRRLIASQEAERRRIAGELHDSLGQNLLLIVNRARQALLPSISPQELREQIAAIRELSAAAITEVRHISHDLRPYQLDQLGLTAALLAMIDGAAQSTGLVIDRKLDQADDALPSDDATNLYRIVQECLNNILKHSRARQARIELERDVRHLRLWVADDGCGFRLDQIPGEECGGGLGLRNISERVRMMGGALKLHSAPGAGTSIEVTIPILERVHPGSGDAQPA